MPEALTRLYQQFLELWNSMDKAQKTRMISILAVSIVCISTAVIFLTRPKYELLVTNVDSKEIGEMSQILEDEKIEHEVTADRSSIKVRTSDKNRAQVALVQQNYPRSSSMTFADAFGKFQINSTESDKDWIKKEYEEKKLADKLKLLENVEMANVTLNLPEKSLFVSSSNTEKASASVVVKTKSQLTDSQVKGIVMLIARSVENLDPKYITVADTNGNILNETEEENSIVASSNKQYELALAKKKELQKNVKDMFSGKFTNFDGINVVANVVLDFDTESTTSVKYQNPEGMESGAPRSIETKEETLVDSTTGQAPGMESNPGNSPTYPTGTEGSSSYTLKEQRVNNEFDQINTQRVKAVGNLDLEKSSMSVTLLYGINVQEEPSADVINNIRQAISNATGILAGRISVLSLKVTPPEVKPKETGEIIREIIDSYGFFALVILLIIALTVSILLRGKNQPDVFAEAAGVGSVIDFTVDDDIQELNIEEKSEVKKQIEKFVKQKPEAVAQLLRNWLSEDGE